MSERLRTSLGLLITLMLFLNLEERIWREITLVNTWHCLADFEYYYNGARTYKDTGRLYHPMPNRRVNRHDFYTDAPLELKYYLFVPFTYLQLDHAKMVWVIVQHGIYLVTFLLLFSLWKLPIRWWEFTCLIMLYDPTWQELAKGQLACVSLFFFILAFRANRAGRRVETGLWLSAACLLKQHFLYFLPFLLLSGGIIPVLTCGASLGFFMVVQDWIDPAFWSQYLNQVLERNIGVKSYLTMDFTSYSVISRWIVESMGIRPLIDLGDLGSRIASLTPLILFGIPAVVLLVRQRAVETEKKWLFSFTATLLILPNMSMYGLLWNILPLTYVLSRKRWRVFSLAYLMTGFCVTISIAPLLFPGSRVPYWFIPLPWVGMVVLYAAYYYSLAFHPLADASLVSSAAAKPNGSDGNGKAVEINPFGRES